MSEVTFSDADGTVRLRGVLDPPPAGTQDLASVLAAGSDAGGSAITNFGSLDGNGGEWRTLGGGLDTGGGVVFSDGGDIGSDGGSIDSSGGNIATGGGDVNTGGGDVVTGNGGLVVTAQVTGRSNGLKIADADDTLGFFGSSGSSINELPAIPTPQDIADVLVLHGFCTQAS